MAACSYHILWKRCEHFLERSHVPTHNRGFKEHTAIYIAKKHRLCCRPSPFAHPLTELCHVPSHHLSIINNVLHTSHDTKTYAHPTHPGYCSKTSTSPRSALFFPFNYTYGCNPLVWIFCANLTPRFKPQERTNAKGNEKIFLLAESIFSRPYLPFLTLGKFTRHKISQTKG